MKAIKVTISANIQDHLHLINWQIIIVLRINSANLIAKKFQLFLIKNMHLNSISNNLKTKLNILKAKDLFKLRLRKNKTKK